MSTPASGLPCSIPTTLRMVLDEVLAAFSSRGPQLRTEAADFMHWLIDDSGVEVVPQTDNQFRLALRDYADRPDQTWSLTGGAVGAAQAGSGLLGSSRRLE